MHIGDFDFYRDFLHRHTGLILTSDKSYLLDSRLTPVAQKWNYKSLKAMTMSLRGIPHLDLVADIVDAMVISDTSFFRDTAFFTAFGTSIMPWLLSSRAQRRNLRVWCAGCSSGQEAYSMAMTINDHIHNLRNWSADILATDISRSLIAKARAAQFSQFEIQQGVPSGVLTKYFTQHGHHWQVTRDIWGMVRFEPFNLLDDMHHFGKFDVILCRNVISGFDDAARKKVLTGLTACLDPGSLLILGLDETLSSPVDDLKPVESCPGTYSWQEEINLKPARQAQQK